jgi:hypothetical protein
MSAEPTTMYKYNLTYCWKNGYLNGHLSTKESSHHTASEKNEDIIFTKIEQKDPAQWRIFEFEQKSTPTLPPTASYSYYRQTTITSDILWFSVFWW